MLKLENVLLVDSLNANLISIGQLYDQNLFVEFIKNKCSVIDTTENRVMEGERSFDSCHLLTLSTKCFTI